MIAYTTYETDNRVMRYAEELARRGDRVDVYALKSDLRQADVETVNQVTLHRIQQRPSGNPKRAVGYVLPVIRFGLRAFWNVTLEQMRCRYDLVHVHNVPDFLVFAAWALKLSGTKVILDIHDILPEFYASKFHLELDSVGSRALRVAEAVSARFADHVIVSNHLWRDKYAARTGANGKCSVLINNVDGWVFRPSPITRQDGKRIILFPGALQWHQGLDIALHAFVKVNRSLPAAEFHIYGAGSMKQELIALAMELGLEGKVHFCEPLPLREMAKVMARADLGVVPKRADSFGNEAYSTKIMEFMSVGVPVVVADTKVDRYYFDDAVVRFFESGNPDALAAAMLEVLTDTELRRRLVAQGLDYAARNNWQTCKTEYLRVVDALCG